MKNKSVIVFDLDGTLIDSAPDLLSSFNELLRRYQRPEISMATIRPLLTHGSKFFLKTFFDTNISEEEMVQLRKEYLMLYSKTAHQNSHLFPGMSELLHSLNRKNIPWGIVTNKLTLHTFENLASLNLPFQPHTVVCGDTLAVAKPDPAPLLYACDLLNIETSHVIFVGDSEVDAEAGFRAGIDTVIVEHGYHHGIETFKNHPVAGFIREPLEILNFISFPRQG